MSSVSVVLFVTDMMSFQIVGSEIEFDECNFESNRCDGRLIMLMDPCDTILRHDTPPSSFVFYTFHDRNA